MLSVAEALDLIAAEALPLPPRLHATLESIGLVLGESVASDIDSPPYDKSTVDGIALQAASITARGSELEILEEITAGNVPTREVVPGHGTRIMTGAPIPPGADAVVMVEKTEPAAAASQARVLEFPIRPGQNIMRRGISMQAGQAVLAPGDPQHPKVLTPAMLGLLAEVGRTRIRAYPRPTVALLSTGNELVDCEQAPGPGQIRNSNRPMIWALIQQAGGTPWDLGVARDTAEDLSRSIRHGLRGDIFVLSGGVSAGVLDLVPQVLGDHGVRPVFHKVDLKPGKPLWFGVSPEDGQSGQRSLVFGLPGNPVSSLVCFELFVRPAIAALMGKGMRGTPVRRATLTQSHQSRGSRPTYWPARFEEHLGAIAVTPLSWKGSGDLKTLADANCLAHFPGEERLFAAGETVTIHLI